MMLCLQAISDGASADHYNFLPFGQFCFGKRGFSFSARFHPISIMPLSEGWMRSPVRPLMSVSISVPSRR